MRSPYFPARTVLFHKEPNGVTYRVPGLLYLSRSRTFLAFCEERLSPSDSQAHLLVMRKGTFYRNYVEWEDMRVLGSALLPGHRSMNPCPVYDEFTGHSLPLLHRCSRPHNGPLSPSVLVMASSSSPVVCWFLPMLTTSSAKSALDSSARPPHTPSASTVTPTGRSWRFGEAVPGPESVECQMVSVDEEDGTNVLYCNARSPLGYRVQALSVDDGAVFQQGQLVQRLVEPRNGCHGSTVGFPAPLHLCYTLNHHLHQPIHHCRHWTSCMTDSNHTNSSSPNIQAPPDFLTPTWVVYSHPTWTNARKDLGVFLSLFPRDPDSWRGPWVIYEGPSAYSDLAYLELPPSPGVPPAVAFACLFECGSKTAYDEICFCIFTLYELIDNLPRNVQLGSNKQEYKRQTSGTSQSRTSRHDAQNTAAFHQVKKRRKKSKLTEMCSVS
ncbi:Sialidase-3 [Collichthys lucidus]|uniref:Sialidase-3 n=1 Tax=Collichthys lucidus TaxID=240159 RepID=A0A4U5UZY7_COLLU|nr:Sialidase-3 [Collichthys lucidus]